MSPRSRHALNLEAANDLRRCMDGAHPFPRSHWHSEWKHHMAECKEFRAMFTPLPKESEDVES